MSNLSWSIILSSSLQGLWISVIDFLPKLFGALIVLVAGILIASALAHIIKKIIQFIRIDNLVAKLKIEQSLEHAGIKIVVSDIFAWIVKWFVIFAFFVAAADILELDQIVYFLNQVLLYLPNVAVAVAILLIGMLLGSFVSDVVSKVVLSAKMKGADFLALLAKWAIIIFAIMAALIQLQVAEELIKILFTGIVVMLALAGGLAFGLGCREQAGKLLEDWINTLCGYKKRGKSK